MFTGPNWVSYTFTAILQAKFSVQVILLLCVEILTFNITRCSHICFALIALFWLHARCERDLISLPESIIVFVMSLSWSTNVGLYTSLWHVMCLNPKRILILDELRKKYVYFRYNTKISFWKFYLYYLHKTPIQKHQCVFFLSGHRFFFFLFSSKKTLRIKECCGPSKTYNSKGWLEGLTRPISAAPENAEQFSP